MTSASISGESASVHTLRISSAGEDRDCLAHVRVLRNRLSFMTDSRQNLSFHLRQTCSRRRPSRRQSPGDETDVN